jgi:CMP-N-acetylneuraminic acid synthetase
MRIIGEIPARGGSTRIPRKNLRPLDGKPLMTYAITAAKRASTLHDLYVNSDSDEIGALAQTHGVKYYKRPAELGTDTATQDEFNYDFIKAVKPDVLVMVNPASPLIDGLDIDAMVKRLIEQDLDTLIPVKEEYLHAIYQGAPVNFEMKSRLARTQDLPPIQLCVWSICVWRARTFIKQYEEHGHAAFSGDVGFYPLSHFKAIKISTEEDFLLAELLMRNRAHWKAFADGTAQRGASGDPAAEASMKGVSRGGITDE